MQPIQRTQLMTSLTPRPDAKLETDLDVTVQHDTLGLRGEAYLQQSHAQKLIETTVRDARALKGASVSFDAKNQRYTVAGDYPVWKINVPLKISFGLGMDRGDLQLTAMQVEYPGPQSEWLEGRARKVMAESFRHSGLEAKTDGKDLRIGLNSLVRSTHALPRQWTLDSTVPVALQSDAKGHVTVRFGDGAGASRDGLSRVRATLDPAATKVIVAQQLGGKYHVEGIELQKGAIAVKGKADFPELRDALNGLSGLFLIATGQAARLGSAGTYSNTVPKIGLDLAMKLNGDALEVKPSMARAVTPIAEQLRSGGLPVTQSKTTASARLGALLGKDGQMEAEVSPEGFKMASVFHADQAMGTP